MTTSAPGTLAPVGSTTWPVKRPVWAASGRAATVNSMPIAILVILNPPNREYTAKTPDDLVMLNKRSGHLARRGGHGRYNYCIGESFTRVQRSLSGAEAGRVKRQDFPGPGGVGGGHLSAIAR